MLLMQFKYSFVGVILLALILCCPVPSLAGDNPAIEYNESGTVLSTTSEHGHFYQVATEGKIFLLLCDRVKSLQFGPPECKIGDKPIASGDTVHFRVDGDWAYIAPIATGMEQKLRILTVELRVIPKLAPKKNEQGSNTMNEPGVVIGSGLHVKGQHRVGWSTNPTSAAVSSTASAATPVIATAPVTAIPVTGGAPVVVMPTGPTTGGVITGVPVTGGAPVTAIPTAPVTGVPVGGAQPGGATIMIGGGPQWVHVIRIQTDGKIYQLECSSKPCSVANKEIALGDTLTVRTDKKSAYLSSDQQGSKEEQKYKILSVTEVDQHRL